MMSANQCPTRFGGENLHKRIKRHRKAVQKQLKAEAEAQARAEAEARAMGTPGKPRTGIRAWFAAKRAQRREVEKLAMERYKAGLERYIADPACFDHVLNQVLFEDEHGAFTGKDLLKAADQEISKDRKSEITILTFATATVIIPLLSIIPTVLMEGHANIYEMTGPRVDLLVDRFSDTEKPKIKSILEAFDREGLLEIREEKMAGPCMRKLTPLGKKLLAHDFAR